MIIGVIQSDNVQDGRGVEVDQEQGEEALISSDTHQQEQEPEPQHQQEPEPEPQVPNPVQEPTVASKSPGSSSSNTNSSFRWYDDLDVPIALRKPSRPLLGNYQVN